MGICLLCVLLILICFFLVYHVNSFPKALFPNERTAILISGELRSGNISLMYLHDENHKTRGAIFARDRTMMKHRVISARNTPIMTSLTNLITPFALHGGVDVFLCIVAYPMSVKADKLSTLTPGIAPIIYAGDTRPCELFSNHPIFGPDTDNNVFCKIEVPSPKNNIFIEQNPIWDNYCFGHVGKSGEHVYRLCEHPFTHLIS
jgi:hypothetical protein